MSKAAIRRQIFVNRPIQGALISRVALYWLLGMFIQALLIMLLSVGTGSSDELGQRTAQFWWHLKLILVSSLLTLPLLVLDIIKLSHRWVGPIYRLRSGLQALAMGEPVKPITFRAGDYWKDLAEDFNAVLTRVDHLEQSRTNDAAAADEPEQAAV